MYENRGETYGPSEDGFVFAKAQIMRHRLCPKAVTARWDRRFRLSNDFYRNLVSMRTMRAPSYAFRRPPPPVSIAIVAVSRRYAGAIAAVDLTWQSAELTNNWPLDANIRENSRFRSVKRLPNVLLVGPNVVENQGGC